MALVSVMVSTIAAFAVTATAWMTGSVGFLGALGLYLGVGFAAMIFSLGAFLLLDAVRRRPASFQKSTSAAPISALATVPVRSTSS